MGDFLNVVMVVSAVLMVILILLSQRGATLGSGMSASGELYTKRVGLEKSLFITTIVCAVCFVGSIFVELLLP
ncbi:MAG: preprotein translocase subunit SecG [Candidatus Nomurabacteria bacterium]|jgi:protein translocase SecG subunit|nr:preprotein translocase subunit SecG [Candidatus Nomurabacteria bacterium]